MDLSKLAGRQNEYIYGTISVFLVSILSLSGVAILPCLGKRVFSRVKLFLVALSIGTLTADAIIHLIPQAIGLHGHNQAAGITGAFHVSSNLTAILNHSSHEHDHGVDDHESHEPHGSHESHGSHDQNESARDDHGDHSSHEQHDHGHGTEIPPFMWKLLVTVACIYGLWLFESIHRLISGHSHHKVTPDHIFSPSVSTMPIGETNSYDLTDHTSYSTAGNLCGLKPAAFSILIGDSLHNLCDGFAIGAAFATSTALGITTSLAVASHELPHELGDFVILLASGLSKKWALILNLISALFAFIGLYPGIAMTGAIKSSEQYIFAAVAGMFLYIALVDMAQELMNMEGAATVTGTLLHNAGFLLGLAALALLAIYEDQLYNLL